MKKWYVFLPLLATVFLAGCGKSGQNMSFDDAYKAISHTPALFATSSIDMQKSLQDTNTVDFAIQSASGFKASGQLVTSGAYNMLSGSALLHFALQAKAFEPSIGTNIIVQGLAKLFNNGTTTYGYIDSFALTPETGSVDGGIMNEIIRAFSKKRIQLSSDTTGGLIPYQVTYNQFLSHIESGRQNFPIFKQTEKTTIDGYTAYGITWNPEGISGFVNYLLQDSKNLGNNIIFSGNEIADAISGLVASPITGHIIIYGENNVVLRVDSIQTKDAGLIAFSYSEKEGLTWNITNASAGIITGSLQKQDDELAFSLNIPGNSLVLSGETQEHQNIWQIGLNAGDLLAQATIHHTVQPLDIFSPITITGSVPLSQILQGLGALGLTNE